MFEPGCAATTTRSRPNGIGRPNSSASSVTRPERPCKMPSYAYSIPSSPFSSVPTKPRTVEASRPAVSTRSPVSSSFKLMPRRLSARTRAATSCGTLRATHANHNRWSCSAATNGGIEFTEDALQLRNRQRRIYDLARYGVHALRRERADQYVAVTVENTSAARKDLNGIGALLERLLRVQRSV